MEAYVKWQSEEGIKRIFKVMIILKKKKKKASINKNKKEAIGKKTTHCSISQVISTWNLF